MIILLLRTVSLIFSTGTRPGGPIDFPTFRDFPVASEYRGKIVAPRFKDLKRNKELYQQVTSTGLHRFPWKWQMDTVIQRHVDLAGHYIFVHGSAGGNSALYNAVDAKTGFIYPFPYDLKVLDSWQYEHQSDHRKKSRLLIMHGLLFDGPKTLPEIPFGEHYFLFEKQRFKYIGSVLMSNPEGKLAHGSTSWQCTKTHGREHLREVPGNTPMRSL